MNVVILDTEFTTWEGAMARNWSGPNEFREIVQIGAVRINAITLAEEDRFEVLVKPHRNPILSDYFINLTGITQAAVDGQGLNYPAALGQLLAFAQDGPIYAYGGDLNILAENMGFNNLPIPSNWRTSAQSNLSSWFHTHAPETQKVNSGRLAMILGCGEIINEHSGLADALSIVAGLRELVHKRHIPNPFA